MMQELDLTTALEAAASAHYEAMDSHAASPHFVSFSEMAKSDPLIAHAYREHIFEAVLAAAPHIAAAALYRAAGVLRSETSPVASSLRLEQMAGQILAGS